MAIGSILQISPFNTKPSAPPVGSYELYVKTDNTLYLQDSSGNEYAFAATTAITELTGDVSAVGPGSAVATVNFVGGQSAANVASATVGYLAATSSNTLSTIVKRDSSGNFSAGTITAALSGNATTSTSAINFSGALSGDVTGTQSATAIASTVVTGKLLTGYSIGANTPVLSTDSLLIGIEKLQGQISASTGAAITSLTGDVSAIGPGAASATVNSVGGSSAANIHSAELTANAATSINTASTIVKRDASGNFAASTITASLTGNVVGNLTGNVTGNVSGSSATFTGNLVGDVTGTQGATAVSTVGGKTASDIASAITVVDAATPLNMSSTLVSRDASGNFSAGTITAALSGNATTATTSVNFSGNLVGDVTGTQGATAISSATVTGKLLTGYSVGTNTPLTASDSILLAFEKIQGQLNSTTGAAITALTGDVSAAGPGSAVATVNSVGGSSAANIHSAELDANAATSLNTVSTIVKRDGSGNFAAGTITATFTGNLTGNVTGNVSGSSATFTGQLVGDVTGTQGATSVIAIQGHAVSNAVPTDAQLLIWNNSTTRWSPVSFSGDILITNAGVNTIQSNVVGNTKLAQMTSATVKANVTGGTANAADVALGTVTEATSAVLTLTGWTNSTIGSPTITVKQSSTSQSGYLSSTDWNTFNGKQGAGNYITALTGDVVATGPGSAASTIQPNVVANTKLAQAPANTIKGNNTGVTANVTDLTISQVIALLGDVTTVGAFNGGTANVNGASITSPDIFFQTASASFPGMVDTTTQTFAGNKTFSGQTAISNTSTTALIINSTAFVFDATNNALGIGIQPSSVAFVDAVNSTAASKTLQLTGYGIGSTVGTRGRFARGTSGTPTAAQSGDIINFWSARGYGASQFAAASTASISAIAGETFTNTSNLTYLTFNTAPTGSVTSTENMRIASTGVTLGPQTASTLIHQINGGIFRTTRTITTSLTIDTTTTDDVIFCNQSGAISITLPAPTLGRSILIKDISGTTETDNITLVRHASEKIEGLAASRILYTNFGSWTVIADGTNWWLA